MKRGGLIGTSTKRGLSEEESGPLLLRINPSQARKQALKDQETRHREALILRTARMSRPLSK